MCSSTVPTVCILGEPENSSCDEMLDSELKYSLGWKKKKKKKKKVAGEGGFSA